MLIKLEQKVHSPKLSRNAWNFSTKSGLVQNLWTWKYCTIAYNICHWKHYILHTKFITLRQLWVTFGLCFKFIALIVFDLSCSQNLNKLNFLYVSLNRKTCSLKSVDHYENLIWSTTQHCENFSLCFRFLVHKTQFL